MIPKNGSKERMYAKILVDVDLTNPLIRGTKICFEGEKWWVMFKYESLPILCFYCGKIGQGEKSCGKKLRDVRFEALEEGQYGLWMREKLMIVSNKGRVLITQIKVLLV